jgi:iron complex outermembrane receptor protein
MTPYIEAKVSTELMGRPLTGNFGVQAVYTDQRVSGVSQTGGWPNYTFSPFAIETKYWDILPSLNLKWKLQDNQDVRLGIGRSLARPRFDQMGGGTYITYTAANALNTTGPSPWSGNISNPRLMPWISDDLDLTYERYYAPGEGVSIEGFFKYLETFIYDKTTIGNFQGYYDANNFPPPAPKQFLGPVTEYVNATGGEVYGVTVNANVYLKHISPVLDGFGVSGTVTSLQSTIHIPDPNTSPSGQVPEMSHFMGNISLYWEKWGYSIRINDRYRSSYVQEVPNFNGTLQAIEGAPENTVDLQMSYTFTEGRLKGLNMNFSAENLTDTPMNSFVGKASYPEYYKLFGTNLLFGMKYKF